MSNPQANERTALSEGPARYDATGLPPTGTSAAATLPEGFVSRSNRSSLARLVIAVVSLSAVLLVAVLLSSAVRVASTPDDSRASEDLAAVASTTTGQDDGKKIIPSMQPFSTVDPANAHCPHMDRPEVCSCTD